MKFGFCFYILTFVSFSALSAKTIVNKDIAYLSESHNKQNLLDVYYPSNIRQAKDVLVFIHGGSWNSGKKDTYWWLGKNMASKNVVTVIINYSLGPEAQYEEMASDCAAALKWVSDSISTYGGRTDHIFVMGHSAGGHLAALINNDPRFFSESGISNPIKAVILNDGFGLDMFEYLKVAEQNEQTESFLDTFSEDEEVWKTASPMYYLQYVHNPFLIFVGERTYKAIKIQSNRLFGDLSNTNKPVELYVIKGKRHIGMISQMIFRHNEMYDRILDFMHKYQ